MALSLSLMANFDNFQGSAIFLKQLVMREVVCGKTALLTFFSFSDTRAISGGFSFFSRIPPVLFIIILMAWVGLAYMRRVRIAAEPVMVLVFIIFSANFW